MNKSTTEQKNRKYSHPLFELMDELFEDGQDNTENQGK